MENTTPDVVSSIVEAADFTSITNAMGDIAAKAVPAIILGVSIWVVIKVIKKAASKIG
jgi:hypothetical protein